MGKKLKIHEIDEILYKRMSEIQNECNVFFAFSNEQFKEKKTPLKEGEKYVRLSRSGFIPEGNIKIYKDKLKEWDGLKEKLYKENTTPYQEIAYHLANHECFYSGDITVVVGLLSGKYSYEEIYKVYKQEYNNYAQANTRSEERRVGKEC